MNKKIIASVLAVVFTLSIVAVPVSGATVEELQEQINQLTALIASLQAQLAGQTSTPSRGAVCFHTDLEHGMTSAEVLKLQQTLNLDPATRVATSGAGAPGSETTYFGSLTLAAVKAFQAKHGIITTGYVGPLTRAQLNALYCTPTPPTTVPSGLPEGCTSTSGFSPVTGEACSTSVTLPEGCTSTSGFSPITGVPCSGTTTTTVGPSYGTLSVQSYPLSSSNTNLYGGQTYEVIAGQYKATGSDITLRKIAVQFRGTSAFPWQYFSTVSVWDGSTMLAQTAVTQANLIEDDFAANYTVNISGLNYVIPNGSQKVLTIKATLVPTIVTEKTYTIRLVNPQAVYTDTAGVTYTSAGDSFDSGAYTIKNANTAAITITPAADNPLEGNIIGSTSGTVKTDLLKFNVKVENVNVTLNSATSTVTYGDDDAVQLSSLELCDGAGNVIAAAPAPTASGTVSWTNFTLPISAGTTKSLTIKGIVKQLDSDYDDGDTVKVSDITFKGMDSNSNAITQAATVAGNDQHIYLVAPTISLVSVTGQKTNPDSGASTYDGVIKFSVTANGGDIYIHDETEELDTGVYGVTVEFSNASNTGTGFTYTSDATHDETNDYYTVYSGTTKTFTVSAHIVGDNKYANAFISKIYWTDDATQAAKATTTGYELMDYGITNLKTDNIYLEGI